jgi:hypothetical protein
MALEGSLQDMSLSDLIQVFRMGPKTGVLLLVNEDERGVIYVAAGRMVDAAIVRGTERLVVAKGDEAVIQMLTWDNASFVFRHNPSVQARSIRIENDGEWLILEGMRRREDPMRAMPYQSLTLDTRLELAPVPNDAKSGVSLNVNQWRVLSQVANSKDLRDICRATGLGTEAVIRTVAELMSIGLVEVMPPERPKPQAAKQAARAARAPQPQLAFAGNGIPGEQDADEQPSVSHNLLNAIMRRIRGL